jgi:hypothetical protein
VRRQCSQCHVIGVQRDAGAASQLVFLARPADLVAGDIAPAVQVQAQDAFGNAATFTGGQLTLLGGPADAVLAGTTE